ncbi:hypothetical protein GGI12_002211 [Dipsacomyces acuminosporus]|nr:hypothetical protein GGI12_002211 [Dipsacomyces acuminosporus]
MGLRFDFEQFTLVFDSIQSDPYASPSKMRVRVSQDIAKFPDSCYSSKARKTASVHYLSRLIHDTIVRYQAKHRSSGKGGWRSAKGGSFRIDCPGQEVVERTSAVMNSDYVEARLTAELPAAGRTILGSAARKMMLETLPQIVKSAMVYEAADGERMQEMVECIEDQENLREQLATKGLVAFIGNGSVLPRHSGVSSLPLDSPAVVEFRSPRDMQVSFKLPNRGKVAGMGIPHGVTLITGGGFHGKSTVLQAVERGVYNHVPGDGRELVVTERTATKIKAEEGRFVCNTDIRPFISNLPFGKDTRRFTTLDASGSTSMAASIQEALEAGAKAFMFDEDTCATNFLVRDGRMQRLVARDSEPITPLVSRIRELWRDKGVSTIVVIGGCGDYLDVADTVLNMHEYTVSNVTSKAKEIAARMPVELEKPSTAYGAAPSRLLGIPKELVSLKPPKAKTRWTISLFPSGKVAGEAVVPPQAHGCGSELEVENEANAAGSTTAGGKKETEWQPMLDVSALDQLATASQTRCIARIVHTIGQRWPERKTVAEWLALFESKDLDDMDRSGVAGDLARPRGVEVAFALNRLRYADFS